MKPILSIFRGLPLVILFVLPGCNSGDGGGSTDGGGTGGGDSLPTDLEVVSVSGAPSSANSGDTINLTVTIRNNGPNVSAGAGVFPFLTVSSRNDPFVALTEDAHIGHATLGVINAGASVIINLEAILPANVATGTYYLGVGTYNGQPDADLANNIRTSVLMVQGTTCGEDAYESNNTVSEAKPISLGVPQQHNHCLGTQDGVQFTASAGVTYGIYTSDIGSEGWPGLVLYGSDRETILAASTQPPDWDFNAARITWTAPASGTYFVRSLPILGIHFAGANTEYTLALGEVRPDLIIQSPLVSGAAHPNGTIAVSETVFNQGFTDASAFDVGIYLSADATLSNDDTLIGTRSIASLAVGTESASGFPVYYTLPASLATATYYVFAVADRGGAISEIVETNNNGNPIAISVTP